MAKKKKTASNKKRAAKKKTPLRKKKTAKKSKGSKAPRAASVKRRPPAKKQPHVKSTEPALPGADYGPTFFLTAESETSLAYEIDGTPHSRTVHSYRQEKAAIREFEEQDGKILYKVKPLKSPAG